MHKYANKKLSGIPESIFSTMSRLAFEYQATNLGQGFPDFDGPAWLPEMAYQAMKEGKNQYAPSPGIMSLKQNIAEIEKKYYNLDWNPLTEMTITAGATEGLYSIVHAFVEAGDEVVMFEPFYDAYQADVILAGGIPKYVTLKKPDFTFELDELEKAVTDKTKMIIINTPHNPTGKMFSKEELESIAKIAIENDLLVLSDEVYEFLTYGEKMHIPTATIEGMKDRTITVSSTGKTFGMTGWKIGYICANAEITEAIRGVHQWTTFAVNTPGQHAMAYGFSQMETYLPSFQKEYKAKRDLMLEELDKTKFKAHNAFGSYFIMVDIPAGFADDVECATKLVKELGVATIPPSIFYGKSDEGKSMLRLCFAKKDETIIDGIRKMGQI